MGIDKVACKAVVMLTNLADTGVSDEKELAEIDVFAGIHDVRECVSICEGKDGRW